MSQKEEIKKLRDNLQVAIEQIDELIKGNGSNVRNKMCMNKIIFDIKVALNLQEKREIIISDHLKRLGVKENCLGYWYLMEAVSIAMLKIEEQEIIPTIGEIYIEIVSKYNTTYKSIEKAMRYARKDEFLSIDVDLYKKVFSYHISEEELTNSKFVLILAEYLISRNK